MREMGFPKRIITLIEASHTQNIIREVKEEQSDTEYDELSVGGATITESRYADDTALFSTTHESLGKRVEAIH